MSILSGIPVPTAYTKVPTDEWEAVQAELAKLQDQAINYAQDVVIELDKRDQEILRLRSILAIHHRVASVFDNYSGTDLHQMTKQILLPPKPEGESDAE